MDGCIVTQIFTYALFCDYP